MYMEVPNLGLYQAISKDGSPNLSYILVNDISRYQNFVFSMSNPK